MRWLGSKRRAAEARKLREQAEQAEAHARDHVLTPLRRMRAENHVTEAIIKIARRGAAGAGPAR